MIDQRGRLLMAAVGFAGCTMPSYDRALWALRTWLDSWPGVGHVAVGIAPPGLRPAADPVRRPRLARDAAGGVGGVGEGQRGADWQSFIWSSLE